MKKPAASWIFTRPRVFINPSTKHSRALPITRYFTQGAEPKHQSRRPRYVLPAALAAAFATLVTFYPTRQAFAEAPAESSVTNKIRLAEVKQHGPEAERKWVVKGTKVYDITDWIPGHPGGEVILRAVGGTIDKYWDIFSVHKKQEVYDILDTYCIGELDPRDLLDGKVPSEDIDDPFKTDPLRDPALILRSEKPCNAESPTDSLDTYLTPNDKFYVRNHLWVPTDDKGTITVETIDGTEIEYSLDRLKSRFEPVTITATLECSGNRRRHMSEEARAASGLQWDVGAISNAEWTGVRLRDVLLDAGFPVDKWTKQEVKHVQFMGAEGYGASIPLEKAVSEAGDVLLVYEMGGKPLPPDHGFPIRVVVPGHVAARSVKWLNKIILSDEESSSQWQRRDYKCFGPNQGGADVDWSTAPAIQEIPVQSAITSIRNLDDTRDRKTLQVYGLEEDAVEVRGYAFSGGGRAVVRVDVSADDGRTWHQAELCEDVGKGFKNWAWKQWKWVVPRRLVGRVFVVKAVDEGYNTQPDSYEPHYNFRGNLTSGWHKVAYSKASYRDQS